MSHHRAEEGVLIGAASECLLRRKSRPVPRPYTALCAFHEAIFPDALILAAEEQAVVYLDIWPLRPMRKPIDHVPDIIAEHALAEFHPWRDRFLDLRQPRLLFLRA